MKKLLFSLLALVAVLPASADNYFTIGYWDSIRIHPINLGYLLTVDMRACFDAYVDHWYMDISYPDGLSPFEINPSTGMSIPFTNRNGVDSVYIAQLSVLNNGTEISSTIRKLGYWDYDGDSIYDTYGTIKWGPGCYNSMFIIKLMVNETFRRGYIYIDGFISSTNDMRGYFVANALFYKSVLFYVGLLQGDVTGDDVINIADATMLSDYLVNQVDLDEFQLKAADVNGDGIVGIADITAINDLI